MVPVSANLVGVIAPRVKRFLLTGLAVALFFNLIVLAAFLWSRGGQTTVVTLESFDNVYRVFVDGDPVDLDPNVEHVNHSLALDGPESGMMRIVLPVSPSTFPGPSGIDRVVVRDREGNELFRDDFEVIDLTTWEIESGSFRAKDGLLVPQDVFVWGGNSLLLKRPVLSDYLVEVTYKNNRGGAIGFHVGPDSGIFYHFELVRDFPNFFEVFDAGEYAGPYLGDLMSPDEVGSVKAIAAMVTKPYPYIIGATGVLLVLTLLLSVLEYGIKQRLQSKWPKLLSFHQFERVAVVVIIAFGFAVSLALSWHYYGFFPHFPDEVMYGFQAKMLAAGRLTTDISGPIDAYFIPTSKPSFIDEIGEWATFYPFGHPLVLAAGELFGAMWLVPPLVGAATLFLTYRLGKHFWEAWTGMLAAAVLAISPFFWMQAGNLLSHNTGTFYILASLYFIITRNRPLFYGALAGIFFGLGINTRPLNMVSLVLPFGALMLGYLVTRRETLRPWLQHSAAFACGVLLLLVAMVAYNWGVTGSAFESTYTGGAGGDDSQLFGFRDGHTPEIGLRNLQSLLSTLLLVITGWPAVVGLAFVMLPFLLGTRNRWDYFVLACALVQMLAYMGYRYSGIFEGPRYWYEAMPFLALLAARGIVLAGAALNLAAEKIGAYLKVANISPRYSGYALVLGLVSFLVVWGSGGWLFSRKTAEEELFVPYEADAIEGVFGIDNRLGKLADQLELNNALVLVEPCGFCFASVFLRNNVDFDNDVVWLNYLEGREEETIAAFPGREVYIATYDPQASIRPYEAEEDGLTSE